MTIAAGFLCKDGVVLCADTQETIPGYIKSDTHKIRCVYGGKWSMAIACAGQSDYVETAFEKLLGGFRLGEGFPHEPDNLPTLFGEVESRLLTFFEKHLKPWPENERPSVDLLIGASIGKHFGLAKYSGTSFTWRGGNFCVGEGLLLAMPLIKQFYNLRGTTKGIVPLAIYTLARVKQEIDSCGGNTDVLVLRREGKIFHLPTDEVAAKERAYLALEKRHRANLFQSISNTRLRFPS